MGCNTEQYRAAIGLFISSISSKISPRIYFDWPSVSRHDWNSIHTDSELGMSLFNLVAQFNLFQLIDEPTRTNENSTDV